MSKTYCGVNCGECPGQGQCAGCAESEGRPFGGLCLLAEYAKKTGASCECVGCAVKKPLIEAFNALNIPDMDELTDLNALPGAYVNMEYTVNGHAVRLLDDKKIYLGSQLHKNGSDRCYGLAADDRWMLVCEYGENGADPEIVVFKRHHLFD